MHIFMLINDTSWIPLGAIHYCIFLEGASDSEHEQVEQAIALFILACMYYIQANNRSVLTKKKMQACILLGSRAKRSLHRSLEQRVA